MLNKITKVSALVLAGLVMGNSASAEETDAVKAAAAAQAAVGAEAPARAFSTEWEDTFLLGYNESRGNAKTNRLFLDAKTELFGEVNQYLFQVTANQGKATINDATGTPVEQDTYNDIKVAGAYRYVLDDRMYLGFGVDALQDGVKNVDYRINIKPVFGYYIIKTDTTKLALEAGPGYIFDKVEAQDGSKIKDDYATFRIADNFEHKLSKTAKVFQTAEYIQSVDDSNISFINAEVGVQAAVNETVSLVLSLKDNYVNTPAPGLKRNDVSLVSSLKVAFKH